MIIMTGYKEEFQDFETSKPSKFICKVLLRMQEPFVKDGKGMSSSSLYRHTAHCPKPWHIDLLQCIAA